MRKTADQIISDLGGLAVVARETGNPVTTVQGWKDANFIPRWHRPTLLGLPKAVENKLSEKHFPTKADRISRKASVAA